ncbi:MAG: DNA topoisomerase I [Candidatus Pacearchaeota archaeon]
MSDKKKIEDPVKHYSEQTIRHDYVPVDESDIVGAVDVPVTNKRSEIIEQKRQDEKKEAKSKSKTGGKLKRKKIEFRVSGPTTLNPTGPMMIITEKPQASQKIADALSQNGVAKRTYNNVPYYELVKNDRLIQVVCTVGHLFTLSQVNARNSWPTFDIKWKPNYMVKKNDFTKKYYDTISSLAKKASGFVVATDYDIEGEVIGMNIIRYICGQKDAERMKFSTLTSKEIQEAFEKRSNSLDWKQGIAGETRHYLDWIYGINLSRALMDAIKTTGKFRLMSIGRVQGPALKIIVEKEHEIQKFRPTKYWQVFADVSDGEKIIEVKYVKDITKERILDEFRKLEGREGVSEVIKTEQKVPPLAPFDLTSLQTEVYRLYKINPSKTLEIAQRLYLGGVISYPRTSSQKIPKEIGYEKILDRLKARYPFVNKISRKTPVEGKKTDPAHPSIFPTGEFHILEGNDKNVYDLIVKRFVACFFDDAVLDDKKISVDIEGKKFEAKGMSIRKKGWMEIYPSVLKEKELDDIKRNVIVKKIIIEEKMTQPPHRYTPASLIKELEKRNLGTKATRAAIIETLYDRGYIFGEKNIQATSLGISLIDTLEKNSPIIIDENLTREMEKKLDELRQSKNPFEKEEKIIDETKSIIYKIGNEFSKNKHEIGKDLVKATEELWEKQKKENLIMQCKICNNGDLTIKYNKSSNRYFIACSAYPDCKITYSLPPNGLIKKSEKICELCGWNMLISIRKGKRPWIFCFNPDCESRQKKEYNGVQNNTNNLDIKDQ